MYQCTIYFHVHIRNAVTYYLSLPLSIMVMMEVVVVWVDPLLPLLHLPHHQLLPSSSTPATPTIPSLLLALPSSTPSSHNNMVSSHWMKLDTFTSKH